MPAANPPGLQRVLVQGVPVWKNSTGELFAWEPAAATASLLKLGTEAEGFIDGWKDLYEPRLQEYRASLAARPRSTTAAKPSAA